MELSPIKNHKILDIVTDKIKDEILSGKYAPGDKLPSEREFIERLQVSRIVVREAFRKLEAVGLLQVKHGVGMFVPETGTTAVYEAFSSALQIQKSTMLEIMRASLIIEPAIARFAAENRTDEHLNALKSNIKNLEMLIKENIPSQHLNVEFHSILAEATQNRILILSMDIITHSISQTVDPTIKNCIIYDDTIHLFWHKKIYKAIEGKKSTETGKLMHQHIDEIYKDIERLIKLDNK
ncbi:MAG: FadR family transcriptional regulator [Spirochaetes bacterium]|nr:FadR family transcriptional regulator [Spirochaetota bacterium]